MLSLTRPCFFNFRLLAVLVVFAGLASSCQSSRPGFSFQPIVLRQAVPTPRPVASQATATKEPVAAPATNAPAASSTAANGLAGALPTGPLAGPAKSAYVAAVTQPQPVPKQLAAANGQAIAAVAPTKVRGFALRQRLLRHRVHAPASQGLGLTVLGLLGIVALVVALIGLAISGGGTGWIITAAIAAGVVLLAYLDPGGH